MRLIRPSCSTAGRPSQGLVSSLTMYMSSSTYWVSFLSMPVNLALEECASPGLSEFGPTVTELAGQCLSTWTPWSHSPLLQCQCASLQACRQDSIPLSRGHSWFSPALPQHLGRHFQDLLPSPCWTEYHQPWLFYIQLGSVLISCTFSRWHPLLESAVCHGQDICHTWNRLCRYQAVFDLWLYRSCCPFIWLCGLLHHSQYQVLHCFHFATMATAA